MREYAHRLLSMLPALLMVLSTPSAMAEESDETPWYRVEIMLFIQSNTLDAIDSEVWPTDLVPATMDDGTLVTGEEASATGEGAEVALGNERPEATLAEGFEWLGDDQLMLLEAAERVRGDDSMQLLWHAAWRQPGLDRTHALPVVLHLPRNEPQTDSDGEPLPYTAPPLFDGELKLVLARYLHILANVGYLLPADPARVEAAMMEGVVEEEPTATFGDDTMSPELSELALATLPDGELSTTDELALPMWQRYRLQESRRMRSSEVHYLDHPLFGIVVQVLPTTSPAADAAAAEQELLTATPQVQ